MGNTKQALPKLQKFDVEILLDKIFQHMLLKRDRKINELAQKEIQQREIMRQRLCAYEEVSFEFISIVGIFNYIQTVKIIMRYCKSLKDYSLRICQAQQKRNFDQIEDLQPYIEGIIWSAEKLNLSYIKEFNNMIYKYFGDQTYARLRQYKNLDAQLKSLFTNIEPTTREIQNYLSKFLKRYNLKMKDFPTEGDGNNNDQGPNNGGSGGRKDDFMDQINNLKFGDDSSKNSNLQQKQDYKDVPLDNQIPLQPYPPTNYQNNNQSNNYQNQNNNFMHPQDVNYPTFDNQNNQQQPQNNQQSEYQPQYQPQYNQQDLTSGIKEFTNDDQNFDDLINKLDEQNGLSGVKKDYQKKDSAMEQQSGFNTKQVLPTTNQQKQNLVVGQKINQKDLDYEATKYYINSLVGKDNDYKIDLGESMKPDEKN